ncbi:MAG: ABC transporter permease [Acidilobaceae archaeon]
MITDKNNAVYRIAVVSLRDFYRFLKYKWWIAGLMAANLADLFVFAFLISGLVRKEIIPNYFLFLAPGIAAIAAFASAFTIGREVMMELRREVHLYLLSLPLSRIELAFGRVLGGVLRGLIYQTPILIAVLMVTGVDKPHLLPLLFLTSVLLTASMSSFSIALSTLTKNLDVHVTIRSIVYFFFFFLSTVFYPPQALSARFPQVLVTLAENNPVSLAADIYRYTLLPQELAPAREPLELFVKLFILSVVMIFVGTYFYLRNLRR